MDPRHEKPEADALKEPLHRGHFGEVWFGVLPDGSSPAWEFWKSLNGSQRAKFMALFCKITSEKKLQLFNRCQFRQVDGELFEFKRNDIKMRMFAWRSDKCWYLVQGLAGKKEDLLPKGEVLRAMKTLENIKNNVHSHTKRR